MNALKKLICALLIFSMLLPMTPVEALELGTIPKFSREYVYFADPLNPDAPAPEVVWPQQTAPQFLNPEDYLSDLQEAAAILREAMEKRQSSVELRYQAPADLDYTKVVEQIRMAAVAHTGEPAEGDYLAWHRGRMGAPASAYTIGDMCYYSITFQMEYYTTAQQEAEVDAAAEQLLTSLDLEGKSDYEKVRAVYQWMCGNIEYDYDNLYDETYMLKYSAYAALINRTAVCQGYASLLYRLCLEMDIDCRVIVGEGNGGAHAWNIVELGGKYYNLDATWDASYYEVTNDFTFFLRTNNTFGDHVRDAAYATDEFNAEYPMGAEDFNPEAYHPVPGDINGDGELNNKDLTRLFQQLSGWDVEVQEVAMDINGDGNIDNKDLTRLFQYLSGWDVEIH